MTYRELADRLSDLNDEQLDCDITVRLDETEEYLPAGFDIVGPDVDELDEGHPVLFIDF